MALVIPVVIQNGDIEDADVVMENFDYIAAHAPSGPSTSIVNNLPAWDDVTGTGLIDSGIPISDVSRISPAAAATESTPGTPTGTTSMVGVMMGLAGTITPTRGGPVLLLMTLQLDSGADTAFVGLRYGTGGAPVNGAALTGTIASPPSFIINASPLLPVTLAALVTGLVIGIPVWIDVSLQSVAGGSVSMNTPNIVAVEL
jgi:hypothetical protein